MPRVDTARTAPVRPSSPYASFILTLIMLILAAILALMIYGAVRARNVSHTVNQKIDNLTSQLQSIDNGVKKFTGQK